MAPETADLVVVGAGTVGGWASVFAEEFGAERSSCSGQGRRRAGRVSRAAGIVRAQGGTPDTVRLGSWSIDFYRRQQELLRNRLGVRETRVRDPAVTKADEREAHERIAMQRATGLDASGSIPEEVRALNAAMAATGYRGGSYVATDGWVDPPRNVRAYWLAMRSGGVELRERTAFIGLRTRSRPGDRRQTTGRA